MGRKQKTNANGNFVRIKRKASDSEESPQKSKKVRNEKWFPGKFVLLNQNQSNANNDETDSDESGLQEQLPEVKKNPPKSKKSNSAVNGEVSGMNQKGKLSQKKKLQNGKVNHNNEQSVSRLEFFDPELETSDDDDDFEELSDEEVSEEWETDTDYDMEEEAEEEESEFDSESNSSQFEEEGFGDYDSADDSDYSPTVEDVYIARGTAKIYDAKGLDLAFGNSTESQIIEISEVHPAQAQNDAENDEIPKLIPIDEEDVEADDEDDDMGGETEKLIKELQIHDEDDGIFESSKTQLLKHATFYNCIDNQGVLVALKDTIHFHGVLSIKAVVNSVQINGYELTENSSLSARSVSHSDYMLNLTPVIRKSCQNGHDLRLELSKFLNADSLETLCNAFNPETECLLHLREGFVDAKLQMLINYLPYALLPSKKMLLANKVCQSSELMLSTRFFLANENRKVSSFQVNDQWTNLKMSKNSRFLICGGKNVGKSALSQYLINSNKFKAILVIDLDIGQPILHAAQTISATLVTKPIIGLGCLDDTLPEKSLLYGDKNVMISPFKYVRCVRELMDFCAANEKYQNIPWIINTMGYQKGFGLQLISLLVRLMHPTDVIQIQHGIKSYNFSQIITDSVVSEIDFSFFDDEDVMGVLEEVSFTTHIVDSIVNNQNNDEFDGKWISNASEKRKMSMFGQLAKLLKGNSTLNDVIPYKAPINKFHMVVIDEEYSHENHGCNLDLLNANLVYLCSRSLNDSDKKLHSDAVYECYGVGLVRGIDRINQQVYILLPNIDGLDSKMLQAKVNVLAICNIPLPSEILLKQGYGVNNKLPYVTCDRDKIPSGNKYFSKRHIKDCF